MTYRRFPFARALLSLALVVSVSPAVAALRALDDTSLSSVDGQDGIVINANWGDIYFGNYDLIDDNGAPILSGAPWGYTGQGSLRLSGTMSGNTLLEMDLSNDGGVPVLQLGVALSNFYLNAEAFSFVNRGLPGETLQSWGRGLGIENVNGAQIDLTLRFASNGGGGTGLTVDGYIPDEFSYDFYYKDSWGAAETTAGQTAQPIRDSNGNITGYQAGYYDNRIIFSGISPVDGGLDFSGMTFDVDANEGWVIGLPTIEGSMEIGQPGTQGGGIILNGERAARVLLEDWTLRLGAIKIRGY